MTNLPVPQIFFEAQSELSEIMNAGARALKGPGRDLLPIKRDMLWGISDQEADLVLDACSLLFSSIISYEGALWGIDRATDPISLVSARIDAGRAEGVVNSLFYGPTAKLLLCAMDRAPIAFYAMSEASPHLKIIDRCNILLNKRF